MGCGLWGPWCPSLLEGLLLLPSFLDTPWEFNSQEGSLRRATNNEKEPSRHPQTCTLFPRGDIITQLLVPPLGNSCPSPPASPRDAEPGRASPADVPGGGEVSAAGLGLPGKLASGRGRESGPYNEEGPGLDLLDLPLQVLPGEQALHVDVQLVPSAEQLLVHRLQPKGTWEGKVRAEADWGKGKKARLGAPAWPQSWRRKWGQWGAMACGRREGAFAATPESR